MNLFSVLYFAFSAVSPLLIMILIGVLAKKTGFLDAGSLKKINRFNFRFAFSAMMFENIYNMDSSLEMPWWLIIFIVIVLFLFTGVGAVIAVALTKDKRRQGVLVMSMYRSNYVVIGLALAEAIAGTKGRELATIFQFPTVFYYNFVSVLVLSFSVAAGNRAGQLTGSTQDNGEAKGRPSFRDIFLGTMRNPLIQGILAGIIALAVRHILPLNSNGQIVFSIKRDLPWLFTVIQYLSRMATPLALIVMGAQLELGDVRMFKKELAGGVIMRLILAPLIGFSLAFVAEHAGLITLSPAVIAMMTVTFGSPLSVSGAVMAQEMGSDEKLTGQIVVWSSVFSMLTLFLIIALFKGFGRL